LSETIIKIVFAGGEGKEDSMRMSEGITGTPFRIFGIHQGPLRFVCFFFVLNRRKRKRIREEGAENNGVELGNIQNVDKLITTLCG
jgi:hypothetical protein